MSNDVKNKIIAAVLESLTVEQAREWDGLTDKWVWVDDNILAPNNIIATEAFVDKIEAKFVSLLAVPEKVRLVDGKIPANTVCPYRIECPSAKSFQCAHTGTEHSVPFSCGFARLFETFGDRR